MKKLILVSLTLLLLFFIDCKKKQISSYTNWYVFNATEAKCYSLTIKKLYFLNPEYILAHNRECNIMRMSKDILILDCSKEREVKGFLFFARSNDLCNKYFNTSEDSSNKII